VAEVSTTSGGAIRDFKDLEVWRAARELRKEIYSLARVLPDFEKFALASQLRRASTSVTATTCIDEGYLEVAEGERLDKLAQTVTRLLNGYLRATLARKRDER